jgi:uncharacterized protein YkwD
MSQVKTWTVAGCIVAMAALLPAAAQKMRSNAAQTGGPAQISVSEQYLFEAANAERAQRGIGELHWDNSLYHAAQAHAQEMASRESISHQYAGEPELADRGHRAGAHFSRIAENVAEAPTAVSIHDAWMQSPGHRENLLDPQVTDVGISVLRRNGQLYAVEDFDRKVEQLSFDEQEQAVAGLVAAAGRLDVLPSSGDSRRTCSMETGYAGQRQPGFVMRFTASDLTRIPEQLRAKIASGRYRQAAVGACASSSQESFTSYSLAVMLYR